MPRRGTAASLRLPTECDGDSAPFVLRGRHRPARRDNAASAHIRREWWRRPQVRRRNGHLAAATRKAPLWRRRSNPPPSNQVCQGQAAEGRPLVSLSLNFPSFVHPNLPVTSPCTPAASPHFPIGSLPRWWQGGRSPSSRRRERGFANGSAIAACLHSPSEARQKWRGAP